MLSSISNPIKKKSSPCMARLVERSLDIMHALGLKLDSGSLDIMHVLGLGVDWTPKVWLDG